MNHVCQTAGFKVGQGVDQHDLLAEYAL
jgi:hypothetical protein